MLFYARFRDSGRTYLVVDVDASRHTSAARRVPPTELRTVLLPALRKNPDVLARLQAAVSGTRLSAPELLEGVPNPDALLRRLMVDFGVGPVSGNEDGWGAARFVLLQEDSRWEANSTSPHDPLSQQLASALRAYGRRPFSYAGETYHLLHTGHDALGASAREAYDTESEAALFALLGAMGADSRAPEPLKAAALATLQAAEAQRAQRGRTELVLLRRRRLHARTREEQGAPVTPSQLQREQHWLEISVVGPDGNPVADVRCDIILPDGSTRHAWSDADGFVCQRPIPQGMCKIRLPEIHPGSWKAKSGAQATLVSQGAPRTHVVTKARDELSSIARQYGIQAWKAVWEDAQNEALRTKRKHPANLRRDDRVTLPPAEVRELVRAADSSHQVEVTPPDPLVRRSWSV